MTASRHTIAANRAVLDELPFADRTDFDNATRGFIADSPARVITNPDGSLHVGIVEGASVLHSDKTAGTCRTPLLDSFPFWHDSPMPAPEGLLYGPAWPHPQGLKVVPLA